MAMSPGSQGGQRAEINVTPMIDVLLVLIIIFMVITPLVPRGLEALVPQPAPPDRSELSDSHQIVVTVHGGDTVSLNQESIALADLGARLADLFRHHPNHVVFVRADKGLEFRQVAQVLDTARGAGLERIGLMTQ